MNGGGNDLYSASNTADALSNVDTATLLALSAGRMTDMSAADGLLALLNAASAGAFRAPGAGMNTQYPVLSWQ